MFQEEKDPLFWRLVDYIGEKIYDAKERKRLRKRELARLESLNVDDVMSFINETLLGFHTYVADNDNYMCHHKKRLFIEHIEPDFPASQYLLKEESQSINAVIDKLFECADIFEGYKGIVPLEKPINTNNPDGTERVRNFAFTSEARINECRKKNESCGIAFGISPRLEELRDKLYILLRKYKGVGKNSPDPRYEKLCQFYDELIPILDECDKSIRANRSIDDHAYEVFSFNYRSDTPDEIKFGYCTDVTGETDEEVAFNWIYGLYYKNGKKLPECEKITADKRRSDISDSNFDGYSY